MSKRRRIKPASNLGRVLGRLLNSHFLKALSQEGDSHPSFLILLQPQSQATPPYRGRAHSLPSCQGPPKPPRVRPRADSPSQPCGHAAQGDGDQPAARPGAGIQRAEQGIHLPKAGRGGGKRFQPRRRRRAQPGAGGSEGGELASPEGGHETEAERGGAAGLGSHLQTVIRFLLSTAALRDWTLFLRAETFSPPRLREAIAAGGRWSHRGWRGAFVPGLLLSGLPPPPPQGRTRPPCLPLLVPVSERQVLLRIRPAQAGREPGSPALGSRSNRGAFESQLPGPQSTGSASQSKGRRGRGTGRQML